LLKRQDQRRHCKSDAIDDRGSEGFVSVSVSVIGGATYTCLFPSDHVSADAITVTNDLVIGGEAVRADELIAAARACVRTEALIDIEIPGGDGISTARHRARSCRCAGL